ncbi:uncharacterized protein CXQ87_000355 [Candidozyma duobushaemuli]|uniref:Transcription factor domain-containing protein n=1 Tax=Candidozyma duobushaemuli TaxID=1231522 RepID=A0A2V1AHK9_9ASCO|nr:uncharacterized protein CXQ87_000355 [[Candida] duobushaemulonis]PVH17469.1 hypothetical protein CXQ87_000355 [[Candida] duobushaemulonis]
MSQTLPATRKSKNDVPENPRYHILDVSNGRATVEFAGSNSAHSVADALDQNDINGSTVNCSVLDNPTLATPAPEITQTVPTPPSMGSMNPFLYMSPMYVDYGYYGPGPQHGPGLYSRGNSIHPGMPSVPVQPHPGVHGVHGVPSMGSMSGFPPPYYYGGQEVPNMGYPPMHGAYAPSISEYGKDDLTDFPVAESPVGEELEEEGADEEGMIYINDENGQRVRVNPRRLFVGNIPFNSTWPALKNFLVSRSEEIEPNNDIEILKVEIPMQPPREQTNTSTMGSYYYLATLSQQLQNGSGGSGPHGPPPPHNNERPPQRGLSRGFAIVTTGNRASSEKLIRYFNEVEFENRPMTVRFDRFPNFNGYVLQQLNPSLRSGSVGFKNKPGFLTNLAFERNSFQHKYYYGSAPQFQPMAQPYPNGPFYPKIDVNNIDALIDVGERNGVSMPSRYGGKDDNELRDLSLLITSGKLPSCRSNSFDSDFDLKVEDSDSLAAESVSDSDTLSQQQDLVITDHNGNRHMIGPLGSPAVFDSSVKALANMFDIDLSACPSLQHAFQGELVLTSSNEPLNPSDLGLLYNSMFPYLDDISFQEATYFTDCFFRNVHPRYPCFVESVFRSFLERFWAAMASKSRDRFISHHTICSIYMVWLLGRLFSPGSLPRIDQSIVQRYLHIIRLCLSDIVLTPTLDGIRTLVLLAIYMENTMRRESAYVLIQVAARHCITLGLHRESSVMQVADKSKVEESRRIWWAVFTMEVSVSCQMGRSSTIHMSDVSASYPLCYDVVPSPEYSPTYMAILDITKVMHEVLKYRQAVDNTESLMSNENLDKALALDEKLTRTMQRIDQSLLDLSMIADYKIHLSMRYHHDRLTISLPFYSKVAEDPQYASHPTVQTLLTQGLRSSIVISQIIDASMSSNMLNGTVHADIFYTFHATMGLVMGYCLMNNSTLNSNLKLGVSNEEVQQAIERIRGLSLSNRGMCFGTLLKFSTFIDAFIAGYDYLRGHAHYKRPSEPASYGSITTSAKHDMSEVFSAAEVRVKMEDNSLGEGFDEYFMKTQRNDFDTQSGFHSADIPQFGEMVFNGGIASFGNGFGAPERFTTESVLPGE